MESIAHPVWILASDGSGRIIHANRAAKVLAEGCRDAEDLCRRLEQAADWSLHSSQYPWKGGQAPAIIALPGGDSLHRIAFDAAGHVLFDWSIDSGKLDWKAAAPQAFGYDLNSFPGDIDTWLSRVHPEDRDRMQSAALDTAPSSEVIWHEDYRLLRADGSVAHVMDRGRVLRDADGRARRMIGAVIDVSRIHEAEARFQQAARASQDVIYSWSPITSESWFSDSYHQTFGLDPAAPRGAPGSWLAAIHPDDLARILDIQNRAIADGTDRWDVEYRILDGEGRIAHVMDRAIVARGAGGEATRIMGSIVDVTRLREEEARLQAVLRVSADVVYDIDMRRQQVTFAGGTREKLGRGWRGVHATFSVWQEAIHPDDRDRVLTGFKAFLASRAESWQMEYRLCSADGSYLHVRDLALALRDENGTAYRVIGTMADLTAEIEAAEKLQQAQRLEAMGKLTGGVAHDFNNLLTVIIGNAEALAMGLEDPARRALAEAVIQAAGRGADLVASLLSFARRRPLRPKALETGPLLAELGRMLGRTLPASLRLQIEAPPGLWPVEADPAQLQTALLNLAVNAADAMPDGGHLLIEAENAVLDDSYAEANPGARAGAFLRISITDTGHGMPTEIAARAFDPFFTTKAVGKGSGLGLSMVHGFVNQSGGHVKLYSEVGIGTTISLYLPRGRGTGRNTAAMPAPGKVPMGQGEHIIIAEDDPALRAHVIRLVESLGYRVSAAEDGAAALALIRATPDAALLFTDVVMPGDMPGTALAEHALAERPGLKILFTSGYTEAAITRNGQLDPGMQLLSKPYRRDELARKLREVLEATPTGAEG
ncbi:hybrid sensor histidine kinase/response regulator [Gemmobacter denitrificans]|uniref:histidine kinase n=1 Tax=Gemmobacter denitrificans TaxID=3123040 RepID=A0ABU8BZE4_9RHOB